MALAPRTFDSIELQPIDSAALPFAEFVKLLLQKLQLLKDAQFSYYEGLRKKNTKWANGSRWILALLGSIAFLLTALAALFRFIPAAELQKWGVTGADAFLLLLVLAIYAVMGAMSFYEKATDKTTSYFRHVGIILLIRDLWTRVQFEILKDLTAVESAADKHAAEPAARERIRVLAEAFCNDLNKASTGELTEWRTEFLSSLSELEAAAKKGGEDVTKQLQEGTRAAEKAAADAKTAAEKAASDARAAAKSAEDAAKPGALNLTIKGDFDDQVAILVDGVEVATSHGKTIALEHVSPGPRKLSARAKKGAKQLEAAYMVDVKPGLQNFQVVLP